MRSNRKEPVEDTRLRLASSHRLANRAFTLLELIVVLIIIGVASTLISIRLGTFAFWEQEGYLRKLSETLTFLHHQAIVDQVFYRIEFNFEDNSYTIGAVISDEGNASDLAEFGADVGTLTLELAAFLSPSIGKTQMVVPPPSFPSLADPVTVPNGISFQDIRTMRGKQTPGENAKPYILFSPRGFSEFSVIHLRLQGQASVTILVNPFTGNTEIIREYKDFEWSYGRSGKKKS